MTALSPSSLREVSLPRLDDLRIGVVGLGYVGLPVSIHLATHFPVVGFDLKTDRISELTKGHDETQEVSAADFNRAENIRFTADPDDLAICNFFIVTVPTPIDEAKRPDTLALKRASELIGECLSAGSVVVYESTVYPGATEEICVPILEKTSGLRFNDEFFVGYSPERINPGDQQRRLSDIVKITSGSTPKTADLVDAVYRRIINSGTFRVSSIRVAEAAKVIENIQRDVNIALINELAMLFKTLNLDTQEVLAAAGTKWNFHSYVPGMVGGHCIGVDPYYLTYKAQSVGFHPEMILAGRRINDNMATFIAQDLMREMLHRTKRVYGARVLILGFAFKENTPDIRNTKVADLTRHLIDYGMAVEIHDPIVDTYEVTREYGLTLNPDLPSGPFDVVVIAVNHTEIETLRSQVVSRALNEGGFVYDVKRMQAFPRNFQSL